MRTVPESQKFIIADHNTVTTADLPPCPNPRGWYHSVAGIKNTGDGLVATYRLSDSHTAVYTHIMAARSRDGGRTWSEHRSISRRNVWEHHACWVAPQLSRLSDGRLVIICDEGHRTSGADWPMLTRWQQRPPRGMANYLFWSDDDGATWSDPVRIDDVGGEPGYITELGDGTLLYTRTESERFAGMEDPPEPWNDIYYRNQAVLSADGGRTWVPGGLVSDAPYHGDSEVGTVEVEPGHLLAVTRIGFSGGKLGQPSRLIRSYDGGRTWQTPKLSPIYGQRTVVRALRSGKLLCTYRHRWGTPASCVFMWDPSEELGFQPTSYIWDRDRCLLEDGVMVCRTESGREHEVEFSLYPAMTSKAEVSLEVELSRDRGGGAVLLSAGFGVQVEDGCVRLVKFGTKRHETGALEAATPWQGHGATHCEMDTGGFHRYRLERTPDACRLLVDGQVVLASEDPELRQRVVRFGSGGVLTSRWRSAKARVHNPDDHSIDWSWDSANGFPDQFERDRVVVLDYTSDSGYSDWTQREDGTIIVADYSSADLRTINTGGPQPVLKAFHLTEEDLAPAG